jgi:hypothetical protein
MIASPFLGAVVDERAAWAAELAVGAIAAARQMSRRTRSLRPGSVRAPWRGGPQEVVDVLRIER